MNDKELTKNESKLGQDIEGYLKKIIETIEQAENTSNTVKTSSGRKKILATMMLWSGVVIGVLRGFKTQAQIWRLVSWDGFWHYKATNVSDQAVYTRLAEKENYTLQKLFIAVRDSLKERLEPFAQKSIAPFATGVYALDGSTLDKMARHLPALREVENGDKRLLPGKMVGLFDIRLQQWVEMIHLSNPNQNDKLVAGELVKELPKKSLILGDLGFFSFAWFDQLTEWGMYWISRMREKSSFEVLHTFYTDGAELFDGIVWLGVHRSDKAAHAVRLVTFTINNHHYRYITNVLDPQILSMHDIAVLYARRWDIELAFKLIKRHLKLHLIWSGKPAIVLHQLWAVLIISQFLHAIQLEIAGLAQVDPFDVSLELLTQYVPRLAYEGKDPIQMIVKDGRRMGFIRPSKRIRPKTPNIDDYKIIPLPPDIILFRKPRYAKRHCKSEESDSIRITKASVFEPMLC